MLNMEKGVYCITMPSILIKIEINIGTFCFFFLSGVSVTVIRSPS